jgi:hypothetical protein
MTLKDLEKIIAERQANLQLENSEYFNQFRNTEFWIWDEAKHKEEFERTGGKCCFVDMIGRPEKNGQPLPMFDYEELVYQYLERRKHLWILKSTGLGITTFILYYIAYKCLSSDKLKGKQIAIVVGPNIDLAYTLIERIKHLFKDIPFATAKDTVILNSCLVRCYPSHPLAAMRSLVDL